MYLLWLAVCTAGRALLFGWQYDRLHDLAIAQRLLAFGHGLRMDTLFLGYLLVVPAMILTLFPAGWSRVGGGLIRGIGLAGLLALTFLETATFPFFAEYDVRPNIIFAAYLEYPREIAALVWQDQKLALAVQALLLGAMSVFFLRRRILADADLALALPWRRRVLLFLPVLAVLFLAVRSSFGHRPANLSDALYSPNRVAGEIAKNSAYSVAYEAYRGRKDGRRLAVQYGEMPRDEAYRRTAALLGTPAGAEPPFRRTVAPTDPSTHRRNLVLIVQESMGAQFIGHLGDRRGLTPHLDELSRQSLTFTELYSNGTRSIRGLSAVSAGFLALAGEGVLKRPKSQSGFFSIAALLKPHGYHTSFIYGGEARFDNMRGWYLGNGFDAVIEEKDWPQPTFRSTWGVCDEDLLLRANEVFRTQHREGRPFASVVFTSSNHVPFDLPEGKIEWAQGVPRKSVENAIKYADFAVGRFLAQARTEPYFANTIFVIVADHNIRVYGDDVVPVEGFHIPAIIHGPGVTPGRHDKVTSQPDVLATALGFLGMELSYPILGSSIFTPGHTDFVLMQFNDSYAFRRGDDVAVLRPNLAPRTFRYAGHRLVAAAANAELERDGLALIHIAEDLYDRRLYR